MAAITANDVKELREKSGAGMLECKKALEESQGDASKALDWLRQKGIASAAKKASREAKEGLIGVKLEGRQGALVEVNCETDFVAKTDDFKKLIADLAQAALGQSLPADAAQAAAQVLSPALAEQLKATIGKLGENMVASRAAGIEAPAPGGLGMYLHADGKLAAVVALSCEKPASEGSEDFKQLARDLAMQVAGAMPPPLAVSRDQVPKEWLAKEEEIAVAQARATGKPEAILKKIAEGKVQKALQEVSLMDQVYLKEPDLTVAKLLAKVGAQLQDKVTITRFLRMKVGESK